MVRAYKPSFDQSCHAVDSRQRLVSRGRTTEQNMRVVKVAFIGQRHVDGRAVRANSGAKRYVRAHKWQNRSLGRALDAAQPDAPKPLGMVNLDSHGNRHQMAAVMALGAGFLMWGAWSPPEREVDLIYLDSPCQ